MHELHQDHTNGALSAPGTTRPIYVKGKFLYRGDQKFYVKGVTYGTFEPREDDILFPEKHVIERDFAMMARHGLNCVRTYTVPPRYVLDIAAAHGLYVMVGLPWEQHLTFFEDEAMPRDIIRRVREGVISCKQHPAILCYAIGNEIPADIVRWYGKAKIENFIRTLYNTVKEIDPDRLVTYVNYPTTEYLDLGFLDFDCYNVYLESKEKLAAYLARLHNLSKDRPLVLAEIGLDSQRNGLEQQAETLTWQIQTIFAKGCAGMFVFGWTDEWWRGGFQIEDWDFGIVDRDRRPKPALHAVAQAMRKVPIPEATGQPFISVVVCSYNGSRTIRDTMEGLQRLHYPHFEVIVINDGSTDNLAEIVREYPVCLISTPNRGLSCARNTGMYYAKGEIIAYIDDDAYPDPHWLDYLAYAYTTSDHGCIGGPNLAPDDDGPIATCVANAPGGPVHVLISDEIAEHVPGCNLSVKREVLMEIGGFDPIYRSAGDDVDVCWRIQQAGYTIGFHPAALVWHHRRNSLRTYWKQQIGYGKAEALLESKWPEKYNGFGHLSWAGRIYGNGLTLPIQIQKEKIFHGTWGSALFQSVYQPADGFLRSIPLMPEWYLLTGLFALVGIFGFIWSPLLLAWPLFLVSVALVVIQGAVSSQKNVSLNAQQKKNYKYRLLIIALHVLQPVARLYGRFKHGLTPWRVRRVQFDSIVLFVFGKHVFTLWSEKWKSSEAWLSAIEYNLKNAKVRVRRGGDFDNWDIQVRSGLYSSSRGLLAIEEHGAGKQMLKLKCTTQYSIGGYILSASICAISIIAAMSGELLVAGIFWMMFAVSVFRFLMETAGVLKTLQAGFLALQTTEHEETVQEPWIEQMKSSNAFELLTEEVMGEQVRDASLVQQSMYSVSRN